MSKNQEERKQSPSARRKNPDAGGAEPDRQPTDPNHNAETKSADAADLIRQNALLRAILESAPGDLFAFDAQGMLLHAPDAWLAGGWYVPGETHLTDMIHLDEKQDAWARFREVLKDAAPRGLELRLLQPDGDCRWSKVEFHPYPSGGKVVQVTAFSVDTRADRAQDTVRQLEEERFSLARRAAQIGIWDWDESAKRLFWDERTIELFGLQPDEFTGTFESWTRAIHPEDLVRSEAEFLEALRGASTYDTEFRILLPQGGVRHIKSYGKIVRDEAGRTVRMTGINIDITELKQSEIRYRNFGRLYATLSQVNQTIVRETKRTDLFEKICQVAVEYGEFRLAWIGVFDEVEGSITPVASAARFGNPLPFAEIRIREHPFSNGLIGRACASGEVCYANDIIADPDMQHWRAGAAEGGYRSAAVIPIFEGGVLVAVFSLFASETDFFVIEEEQSLLAEMGLDISFALDNILREERRLRALEDLRRSEESLRKSQRVAQVGHWTWELRSNRVTWSEEMRRIFDVDPQEFDGDLDSIIAQCIHPEDRERVLKVNQDVLDAERPAPLEYRIVLRDGSVRTIWAQPGEKVYGSDGEMTALTGIVQDITERKATEEALRVSEEKYRRLAEELEQRVRERTAQVQDLYDNAPCGYHSLDAHGNYVMVNQTELDWLGYTREEMLGISDDAEIPRPPMHIRHVLTEEGQRLFAERFPVFLAQGWIRDLEYDFVRKDGSILPIVLNAVAIYDEKGEISSNRATVFDNTERKRAQQVLSAGEEELRRSRDELRLANAALERASHMKDEFLASMSHELRTPLTSILGLAESLQLNSYGELNEKQNGALRNIEESGRHLLALINDILDLSKIEAGRLDVQMQPCSLGEVCRASLLMTRGTANKKRQTVSFTMQPESIGIVADVRRLKQMLVNLLGNAVKFTRAGGSLGLDVVGDAGKAEVRLTVWDTGIGIPAEAMERLFQPFVQLDSRLSREHEGTGLGLTLVQRMAELHGGSLLVQSTPGMGSRFTIVLPWQEPPKADGSAVQETAPATEKIETGGVQLEVLLVDDNETIIAMIRDYLAARGVVVHTAHSGPQMLSLLREIRPDVILLDIQMPGMDGLEAARRLRALPHAAAAATPVIAATSLAMPGDEERCLQAGIDLYLTKPLHLAQLLRTMIRLAEKARPPEADTPTVQPA